MIQYVIRSIKSPRTGEVKYFPQIAPAPPVMRKELIEEIEQKTTLTSTDVKACLDALEHAISNHLVQGQAVRLGALAAAGLIGFIALNLILGFFAKDILAALADGLARFA